MNEKKEVESSKKILNTTVTKKSDPRRKLAFKKVNLKTVLLFIAVMIFIFVIGAIVTSIISKNDDNNGAEVNFAQIEPQAVYYYDNQKIDSITKQKIDVKNYPDAAYSIAVAYFAKGDFKNSVKIYEELVSQTNAGYEVYFDYALAVFNLGDKQRAISLLDESQKKLQESNLSAESKSVISEKINNKKSAMNEYNN